LMCVKSSYTISVKEGASTLLHGRVVVHYCCPVIVEFHTGSLERGWRLHWIVAAFLLCIME